MGVIKIAAVVLLIALAVGMYVDCQYKIFADQKAPVLPETWWRPGNEKTVNTAIRKFSVSFPEKQVVDLKDRLKKTRFGADPLEGTGWTYGTSSKSLREIVDYWTNKYDFKKREAVLNQYPQFITNIQGLDIHFLHVKPQNAAGKRVLPLLLQHGWPGSVVEFYKIIPMLTTPRAEHDFVFELVVPSLPGYGFSDGATIPGLGPAQMAVVLKNLMLKLGHKQFYTQGGDWGAVITADMAAMFPDHVLGMHSNMCNVWDTKVFLKTLMYSVAPKFFLAEDDVSRMFPLMKHWTFLTVESGYFHLQATKPDTIGAALSDTPAGLAAYILEKFSVATRLEFKERNDGGLLEKWTMDELLDNLMMYWIPNSFTTAARIYAEGFNKAYMDKGLSRAPINVPSACAQFPNEIAYQPASMLKARYKNLIRATKMDRGGHFAAMEEPQMLADDVWSSVAEMRAMKKKAESETAKKAAKEASKKMA